MPRLSPRPPARTSLASGLTPSSSTSLSSDPAASPAVAPEVLRARVHLAGLYALAGVTVAAWLARLPTVRADLDLTTGALGAVLLVGSIGSLGAVLAAGALTTRWGSRRTLTVAGWVFAAGSVLLGVGPAIGSVVVFTLGVIAMNASFAVASVPLNVESVVIERRMGRTVVPQFHAAFSVGAVVGSGLGALASWGHLPLLVQFSVVAALSVVWRARSIPPAVLPVAPAGAPTTGSVGTVGVPVQRRGGGLREAARAWRDPRTLVLGVVVMGGALSEGSANTWVAIGVVDGFAAREAIGALVFGSFVIGMTTSRLAGTYLIDRYGRTRVLVGSGTASLAGLVGFALAPTIPSAVVGSVAWGLGAGLVVPIAMAAVAGGRPGAAGRVAVVSALASFANLVAPPVTGVLAEHVGVRHALLAAAVVMVVGLLLSRRATAPDAVESPVRGTVREDAAMAPVIDDPRPATAQVAVLRPAPREAEAVAS